MHLGGRPPVGLLCLSSFASRDKARPLLSTLTLPVQGLIGSLPLDDRRWFGRGTIEGSLKRRYREGNYFRPFGPLLTTPFIPITSKPDHLTTRLKFFCSILLPSPPILLLNIEMYMFAKSKSYQNKFFHVSGNSYLSPLPILRTILLECTYRYRQFTEHATRALLCNSNWSIEPRR